MNYKAILIGASTGGPKALREILKAIKKPLGLPIIISQRMPFGPFTESLVDALNDACKNTVKVFLLKDNVQILPNCAYIIPGGFNLFYVNGSLRLEKDELDLIRSPDIAKTLLACNQFYNGSLIALLLTGLCLDNSSLYESLEKLKASKSAVIVQSPETCFIPDLPQIVIESHLQDKICDLQNIADELAIRCN